MSHVSLFLGFGIVEKHPECRLGATDILSVRSLTELERETGFEPATACLEGRDSTAELLPLVLAILHQSQLLF